MEDTSIKNINSDLSELEKNPKRLITFAKLNKYFIIPFIFPIFIFLRNYFLILLRDTNIYHNRIIFIEIIYVDLTFVFTGLLYFITYCKLRSNKKEQNSKHEKGTNELIFIYNDNESEINNPKKVLLLILLISIFLELYQIFSHLGNFSVISFIYYSLLFPFFTKLILKENIYKHQYFSLLFSLIGSIFLIIPIIFKLTKDDIIPNILNFIKGINYPLFLVITKYVVEKYYISPLKICLIIGIMTIIINLIGYTIYGLIIDDFSFFTDCFNFSEIEKNLWTIIFLILNFLFSIASELTLFLSIFYFYPTLIMVTDIISPLFVWIAETIIYKDEKEINISLNSIGYFIALFSSLIYNELIILNCCGLNKNTKKFVNKRINEELKEIQKSEEILFPVNNDDSIFDNNN